MENNFEKQLNELKRNLENAKLIKYKAEVRLEQLNQQQAEIFKELNELGVKPEDLDGEITKLSIEIKDSLEKANKLLPTNILKQN